MTSPEHARSIDPLSLDVRHQSGKFVVSHPALNLFVEAESLDKAYRQIRELIESHDHAATRQDARSDWKPAWVGRQRLMWSLLVFATKTAVATFVSVTIIALMGITTLSLVQAQSKASIRDSIRLHALARKVESIDPAKRARYQKELQTVVDFLTPFAISIRSLTTAALPLSTPAMDVEYAAPDAKPLEIGKRRLSPPLGPVLFDIAKPPKGRLNPE